MKEKQKQNKKKRQRNTQNSRRNLIYIIIKHSQTANIFAMLKSKTVNFAKKVFDFCNQKFNINLI